ncbi:zinc finger MYM-type protein 1-like [Zophobas morio]|uniref:zinc finger MYM-type protein 1-like n=1 Tax=Zophobas morio TaxID=2755281 RepID=UPI003083DC27
MHLTMETVTLTHDSAHKRDIENYNEKVVENRAILKRLIDAIIYLSTQECSFRGHDEKNDSDNKGNFKELIDLLKTYDSKLQNFLNEATVFTGTSKSIQNDLIESICFVIKNKTEEELQKADFFSWEIDETTDITCKSQLSVILRYVTDGELVERFTGFYDVSSGRNAECLFQLLTKEFNRFDLKNKLIAQTYDGAAVMAGHLNSLQTKQSL